MPIQANDAVSFMNLIQYTDHCWEWLGFVDHHGYGRIKMCGEPNQAHRYAYQLWVGPLIKGLVIMHECDNKTCVNPDHLTQGTSSKNTHDAHVRGLIKKQGVNNPGAKLT